MKSVEHWFSTCPARWDDDWDGELKWHQKHYSHWGERLRVDVGDLHIEAEHDYGEPLGLQFGVDVNFYDSSGQFNRTNRMVIPNALEQWQSHSVNVVFWRWGVYVAWRGRRIK